MKINCNLKRKFCRLVYASSILRELRAVKLPVVLYIGGSRVQQHPMTAKAADVDRN